MTDYKDDIGSLSLERGTGPSMNDEMSQRPSLDITRQQELDKGSANLEKITTSIDEQLNTLLENIDIPNSQKQSLKEEMIDEIYKQGGENAKVTALHYSEESGLIHAEVNYFLDVDVDVDVDVNESLNQQSTFLEQPAVAQSEESTNIPSQTKFQATLDGLSETIPRSIRLEDNPDDYKVGIWDSVTESVIDTAKTIDAFVEVAVADGLNTGTKIGMNVGAVTLGAYHGIKEGSLDEGVTAMREIRDDAVENYKIEASQSSQEILSNSENLQAVGTAIHEGMEYGYNKVGEHLGDEAQFLARGAMEAVEDTLAVTGAGLGARSMAKNIDYTVVNFKYAQLETSPNIAHHIKNFDGYDPKNGVKGAHNRENFTQALNNNNLQVTNEIQGSKGLSEVYYGREKVNGRGEPDGFKDFSIPKTTYDPKVYTDEQILQMGKKAAVLGYQDAIANSTRYYTEKIDGNNFRVYVDPITRDITNFHPSLKGK